MMLTQKQLQVIYAYVSVYSKDVRFPMKTFHKKYSSYGGLNTTKGLINKARDLQVLVGPYFHANIGIEVELLPSSGNSLEKWEKCTEDPSVMYAVLLTGEHSILAFRKGASILSYAESVIPAYPSSKSVGEIWPTLQGKLGIDEYPHGWDELDWEIFNSMRDPTISFPKVGAELGVSWETVRTRFAKIRGYCKPWISFFPHGFFKYYHVFLSFSTEFEVGIREELKKLDRTSYLYKYGSTIMIFLYTDDFREHLSFLKMEKDGVIHDLHISIPSWWHRPPNSKIRF